MNEFEERLRAGLEAVAATQGLPAGFEDRVGTRAASVRRRRMFGRGAFVAVVLLACIGGITFIGDDPPGQTTVAGGPLEPGWHPIADAPLPPRIQALSVAMGDRVLVWGGWSDSSRLDGAVYDTADDTWTEVPTSPFNVGDAVGAWTGDEAIIVSGERNDVVAAAYDPDTNTWRTLPSPPLANGASALNHAVWTGTEVVIVGIADAGDQGTVNQVARYDPATNVWRTGALPAAPLPGFGDAAWTGAELAVVGHVNGSGSSIGNNSLQLYDPNLDRWRELPWGLDGVRGTMTVAWTGDALFIGGGRLIDGASDEFLRDAALVDLAAGRWDRVQDAPIAFSGNERFSEVWTGSAVITLEGAGATPLAFEPSSRTWQVGPSSPIEGYRMETAWVWMPSRRTVVMWSGAFSSTEGTDRTICCSPIEGGETYTPTSTLAPTPEDPLVEEGESLIIRSAPEGEISVVVKSPSGPGAGYCIAIDGGVGYCAEMNGEPPPVQPIFENGAPSPHRWIVFQVDPRIDEVVATWESGSRTSTVIRPWGARQIGFAALLRPKGEEASFDFEGRDSRGALVASGRHNSLMRE